MGLADYEHMWTDEIERFALFRSGDGYIIVDKHDGHVVRIDDPELSEEVKYQMYEAGVELVEE